MSRVRVRLGVNPRFLEVNATFYNTWQDFGDKLYCYLESDKWSLKFQNLNHFPLKEYAELKPWESLPLIAPRRPIKIVPLSARSDENVYFSENAILSAEKQVLYKKNLRHVRNSSKLKNFNLMLILNYTYGAFQELKKLTHRGPGS